MKIYPAVDIMNGKCVRLKEGDKGKATVYNENPIEAALYWKEKGAKQLHVIDLDGAFAGKSKNLKLIGDIIREVGIPVQVGGGLRSAEDIKAVLDIGAAKAVIGTGAVMDEDFLQKCITDFREQAVVSIDARNGLVATNGWVNLSEVSAFNFARKMVEKGIRNIVYTDISKDGMLKGPDFSGIDKMCSIELIRVTASGGITTLEDLERLKTIGVEGAIIGKALYNGNIKLEEALAV
ncbi:MAG: 1-(5-phosphoribosyl)-5-[(5-phosphoribosylamino)methylideneamino]imidazole-4-carboxamide isomerase [Bacillota bacterium]